MENNIHGKLPFKVKLGYGVGTVGDSIPYTLFFTYFIFYLTDYVGLSAALAGVISFVAVLWQAVTGPIIGFVSDNSECQRQWTPAAPQSGGGTSPRSS